MIEIRKKNIENAVLVGLHTNNYSKQEIRENIYELSLLANTAGAIIKNTVIQSRAAIDPAYFIGRGKTEQIAGMVKSDNIDLIVFDDDLSPAQIKNVEKITNTRVIDRSTLILDIFARHARTSESKIQVELAQLNYLLPRLTGAWTHFSKQHGGIGTRGPGETQLEVDRRLVQKRISDLKHKLKHIEKNRIEQSKKRSEMFRASLIGYTNTGKSTLLNQLSKAGAYTADKLFATLDATTRRCRISDSGTILISDTVGFIRKLPHHLIASFQSTLDVVRQADLLIHVIDPMHPFFKDQMITVNQVLFSLGCSNVPCHTAVNKSDCIKDQDIIRRLKIEFKGVSIISAKNGSGINELKNTLGKYLVRRN
ncbi:MAG: GTPase HflX [bacterium]